FMKKFIKGEKRMLRKKLVNILLLLAVASLALSSCSGSAVTFASEQSVPNQEENSEGLETNGLATLEGDVVADGSSTVFPVTTAVAEEFALVAPNVRVSVGLSGTGGGFKKFCIGETDISDASRPIKDSEIEICVSNNIEYVEFLVALDG